jgi:hypothetical protein
LNLKKLQKLLGIFWFIRAEGWHKEYAAELRLTPDESVYILNLTGTAGKESPGKCTPKDPYLRMPVILWHSSDKHNRFSRRHEADIPKFFVELGECVKASGLPLETWYEVHAGEFFAIAKKYIED